MQSNQLEIIATRINELGLRVPALFFLEMHKPLVTLGESAAIIIQPLAAPLFGAERIESLREFFSDRNNVELLIEKLQATSKESTTGAG